LSTKKRQNFNMRSWPGAVIKLERKIWLFYNVYDRIQLLFV